MFFVFFFLNSSLACLLILIQRRTEKQFRQPRVTDTNYLSISASFSGTNWLSLPRRLLTHTARRKRLGEGSRGFEESASHPPHSVSFLLFSSSPHPLTVFLPLFALSSERLQRSRVGDAKLDIKVTI